jgi:PIN domain nuclease of toxin-antitoxin system
MEVVSFDREQAYEAGLLRPLTRGAGLSLGDRACLALARRLGLPAFTADRSLEGLGVGIEVQVIR